MNSLPRTILYQAGTNLNGGGGVYAEVLFFCESLLIIMFTHQFEIKPNIVWLVLKG